MQNANPFHQTLLAELPRLRGSALMLTRSEAAADDLLQETAFRALRSQVQFTPGTNFRAWLYRIMRNEFISTIRKSVRAPLPMDDFAEETFSKKSDQEDKVLTQEVIQAMDKLHPLHRELLVLVCGNGLSYEEAAEVQGCSVGTVKSRLWRARHQMQKLVMGSEADGADEAPRNGLDDDLGDDIAPTRSAEPQRLAM